MSGGSNLIADVEQGGIDLGAEVWLKVVNVNTMWVKESEGGVSKWLVCVWEKTEYTCTGIWNILLLVYVCGISLPEKLKQKNELALGIAGWPEYVRKHWLDLCMWIMQRDPLRE